ncbi:hypothetical protein D3C74_481970 [compost metagenome]
MSDYGVRIDFDLASRKNILPVILDLLPAVWIFPFNGLSEPDIITFQLPGSGNRPLDLAAGLLR